jgi:hypothetical protein
MMPIDHPPWCLTEKDSTVPISHLQQQPHDQQLPQNLAREREREKKKKKKKKKKRRKMLQKATMLGIVIE